MLESCCLSWFFVTRVIAGRIEIRVSTCSAGWIANKDMVFDEAKQNLRCSMHGILYDPITGESLSTMCTGEKLTPVKVQEDEEGAWIIDKRVKPLEQ